MAQSEYEGAGAIFEGGSKLCAECTKTLQKSCKVSQTKVKALDSISTIALLAYISQRLCREDRKDAGETVYTVAGHAYTYGCFEVAHEVVERSCEQARNLG
ncbi:hypothetical protein LTR27_004291 [Elasticomyces elasticus]|nr:hypothetical protein LTR27_004291 [Elasticomyces elasticus]